MRKAISYILVYAPIFLIVWMTSMYRDNPTETNAQMGVIGIWILCASWLVASLFHDKSDYIFKYVVFAVLGYILCGILPDEISRYRHLKYNVSTSFNPFTNSWVKIGLFTLSHIVCGCFAYGELKSKSDKN